MKRGWLVVTSMALFGACGEDTPPATTTAASTTTSGAGGDVAATISVDVLAEDAVNKGPLAGVEICLLDAPLPCATTGGDGRATITAPANSSIWATLVADKYVGVLVGAVTGEEDLELTAPLINENLTGVVASSANVAFDATKGHIGFVAFLPPEAGASTYPPAPGVTITLDVPSGSGPHYVNTVNLADPSLSATGEAGGALWLNVEPGATELTTQLANAPCTHLVAQPAAPTDRFHILTMAGFITYVTVVCTPESQGTGGMGGAGGMGGTGGAGGTTNTGGAGVGGAGGTTASGGAGVGGVGGTTASGGAGVGGVGGA